MRPAELPMRASGFPGSCAIFSTRSGARQKYESNIRARREPVLCAGSEWNFGLQTWKMGAGAFEPAAHYASSRGTVNRNFLILWTAARAVRPAAFAPDTPRPQAP